MLSRKFILSIILLITLSFSITNLHDFNSQTDPAYKPNKTNVNIDFYYSSTCPHCHKVLESGVLEKIKEKYNVSLNMYDVSNINYAKKMIEIQKYYNEYYNTSLYVGGVPFIVVYYKNWKNGSVLQGDAPIIENLDSVLSKHFPIKLSYKEYVFSQTLNNESINCKIKCKILYEKCLQMPMTQECIKSPDGRIICSNEEKCKLMYDKCMERCNFINPIPHMPPIYKNMTSCIYNCKIEFNECIESGKDPEECILEQGRCKEKCGFISDCPSKIYSVIRNIENKCLYFKPYCEGIACTSVPSYREECVKEIYQKYANNKDYCSILIKKEIETKFGKYLNTTSKTLPYCNPNITYKANKKMEEMYKKMKELYNQCKNYWSIDCVKEAKTIVNSITRFELGCIDQEHKNMLEKIMKIQNEIEQAKRIIKPEEVKKKITNIYELRNKFKNGEISEEEYVNYIKNMTISYLSILENYVNKIETNDENYEIITSILLDIENLKDKILLAENYTELKEIYKEVKQEIKRIKYEIKKLKVYNILMKISQKIKNKKISEKLEIVAKKVLTGEIKPDKKDILKALNNLNKT